MPDAQWYEAMAKAMAKREKCINAIARWQADLAEVEAEIEALRTGEQAQQQTPAAEVAAPTFQDLSTPEQNRQI